MHRIDHPTAVSVLPAPGAPGTPGYFTEGDPVGGVPATVVTKDWANSVQEELAAVILAAGLSLDKAENDQLLTAIMALITDAIPSINNASESVAGIIKLATTALAQGLADDTTAITPKKLADALDATAFGRNQTWQDVKSGRTAGTTYTNTTGKPILAVVSIDNNATVRYFKINGNSIARFTTISSGTISSVITALIMPGDTYSVDGWSALWSWWELR